MTKKDKGQDLRTNGLIRTLSCILKMFTLYLTEEYIIMVLGQKEWVGFAEFFDGKWGYSLPLLAS